MLLGPSPDFQNDSVIHTAAEMEVAALQPPAVEPLHSFSNAGTLDDEDECSPSTQQGQQVNHQLLALAATLVHV